MHLSRFRTMATCERILMALSLKILWQGLWQVVSVGAVEPVDLVHFAYHDKLVTVTAHSAVIVKAIGLLRIAANHVRRLEHHAGYRVVVAAAGLGGFGTGHVYDALLGVIHHDHALLDPLADYRAGGQCAVGVKTFNPVVVFDAEIGRASCRESAWSRGREC